MATKDTELTKNNKERDIDLINAEAALKRAAVRARERARAAGIGVVVLKDGQIVEEYPDAPEKNNL